jgi:hypothetical protein
MWKYVLFILYFSFVVVYVSVMSKCGTYTWDRYLSQVFNFCCFNEQCRDIKPQNVLLDPATGVVCLCDFGSAKVLKPGESSVAYICSRWDRY